MRDLSAVWSGLVIVFGWPTIIYLLLGVGAGMLIGLSVGLSGLTGLALLLPFAFGRKPADAFALLLGMYSVTTLTDVIPAVLMGIPGTTGAQALVLDGYAMARKGMAGRALGATFTADVLASVFGSVVFMLAIPLAAAVIGFFGSPEFFMLAMLGVSMVGGLSGRSLPKGLIVAALGLLLATVGTSPETATARFTFGSAYLLNGIPLVPAVLGLFGLVEVLKLARSGERIATDRLAVSVGVSQGIRDALHSWWLILRASALGSILGMIPGLGGPVTEWMGFGHAVQSEKNSEGIGSGDVRGLLGAESAIVAHKPTALVPTVAFGLPANASMALLLGAFLIVGLKTGPSMLTTNLNLSYSLVWMVVLANIVAALLALALAKQLARIATIRPGILVPVMLVLLVVGSVTATGTMGDVVVMLAFGCLGLVLDRYDWPRPPIVLGLILGKIAEPYLAISVNRYGWHWIYRPVVVVLFVIILAGLVATAKRFRRRPGEAYAMGGGGTSEDTREEGLHIPTGGKTG